MNVNSIPVLARGCRLHATRDVLLIPEGTLELEGPARDILLRVDGSKSVGQIVAELIEEYEGIEQSAMTTDVLELLQTLTARGAVRVAHG